MWTPSQLAKLAGDPQTLAVLLHVMPVWYGPSPPQHSSRGIYGVLTVVLGVLEELQGGAVVVGVDEPHAGVLRPEAGDLLHQRLVVLP
ncbi:Os01g0650950 [Oryza sativa Japonica Group]|uniref:Os01g0650950 protein n=1 Tax=Oryza sativa subsp. japonica TaxID=39947 RepID=A0A0P0V5Z1_ORYSJ|nr:hypothetical protein EE612_004688 [Oryza sativa]BAS73444.1 Os01g0650950 [Oryza sativa Japonica Group]